MEMMQCSPNRFCQKINQSEKQLLSESLRGEGAKVVDEDGKRFSYLDYDNNGVS